MERWSMSTELHDDVSQFTVLDGVCVRVSEKFKAPKQLDTECSFNTVDLKKFSYDFGVEKTTVKVFEAEKEREKLRLEEAARITAALASSDAEATTSSVSTNETANAATGLSGKQPGATAAESQALQANAAAVSKGNMDWLSSTILEPTKLYGHPGLFDDAYSRVPGNINISEFEDNNATPFELVEMQSINEFDELMSVLQPGVPAQTNGGNLVQGGREPVFQTQQQISHGALRMPLPSAMPLVDCSDRIIPDSSSAALLGLQYSATSSLPAYTNSRQVDVKPRYDCTTDPGSRHWGNPNTESLGSAKNSKSLPDLAAIGRTDNMSNVPSENAPAETDCNSSPMNFDRAHGGELQERSLSAGSRMQIFGQNTHETNRPNPDGAGQSLVDTNRINNIMSQYKFTRLHHDQGGTLENSTSQGVEETPAWNRTTVLPPLSGGQPLSKTPPNNSYMNSVDWSVTQSMGSRSRSNTDLSDNVRIDASHGECKVSYSKKSVALPPIKTQQCVAPTQGNSLAAANGYNGLTNQEKELASNLTSMGFPPARAVRAIGKHGLSDKEVVDFLLVVQQLSDLGHNELDVEIVLLEVNSNYDQAVAYLETINRLSGLGFPNESVISALKSTNGDSDAALDVLMN